MEWLMDMVIWPTKKDLSIRDGGKIIYSMELEKKPGRMVVCTRENSFEGTKRETESSPGPMDDLTVVTYLKTVSMDTAFTHGQMDESTLDNGNMTNYMEQDIFPGLMAVHMRANIGMI